MKQSQQLQQKKEKFRFNSVRTFNGSDNLNWRAPQTYNEDFLTSRTPFPDISFFRNTPPPDLTTASPCPVPLCSTSPCQAPPRTAPPLNTTPSPHASAPPPAATTAYHGQTLTVSSDSSKETTFPVESLTSLGTCPYKQIPNNPPLDYVNTNQPIQVL